MKNSNKKSSLISGIIIVLLFCTILLFAKISPILIGIFIFGIIGYILLTDSKNKDSSTAAHLENDSELSSKKQIKEQTDINPDYITIQFGNDTELSLNKQIKEQNLDLNYKYVSISTSGDDNVCPMCAQFEGKFFLEKDAPKLPLCPSCACAYLYYEKRELPFGSVINKKEDFVLPAECTSLFYKHQKKLFTEDDINKKIRLCESDLKKLPEFMTPYISAGFPAPDELACRDLLPDLYMQLGKWNKSENAIKKCIDAKAYYPEDGSKELAYFESYRKVADETLSHIFQNPGCLQRNIYKAMGYDGDKKEQLQHFLRNSTLIEKVKYKNTYQLFYRTSENINNATIE